MLLARREPHPVHGGEYEKQLFECQACQTVEVRTVPPITSDHLARAG
jgi:hypothetical protein